jgi:hypothetical protein
MPLRHAIAAVAACLIAGCGGTGVTSRPIETTFFVTGAAQGTQFSLASPTDPCAAGSGITAPNANHQFVIEPTPGQPQPEIFETPRLFVLENVRQPVQAVIQNLDPVQSIQVNLYLGETLQNTITVGPGECSPINTSGSAPSPKPTGPEARVEVCSPIAGLTVPCINSTDAPYLPPPDHLFTFFASIGDIKRSNVTNCLLPDELATGCQTPATFFLEQPQEEVDVAMTVNGGQNPGGGLPNAEVRIELYINGVLKASMGGTAPTLSQSF